MVNLFLFSTSSSTASLHPSRTRLLSLVSYLALIVRYTLRLDHESNWYLWQHKPRLALTQHKTWSTSYELTHLPGMEHMIQHCQLMLARGHFPLSMFHLLHGNKLNHQDHKQHMPHLITYTHTRTHKQTNKPSSKLPSSLFEVFLKNG